MQRLKTLFLRFSKWCLLISGTFAFLFVILSFTDLPYHAYHYLGTCNAKLYRKPDIIVLLGGGGMPSPDGLMRCYYTAEAAQENPGARIVIALPYDEQDSLSQLRLMTRELVLHGIDSSRISYEPKGFNTHSQAENIAAFIGSKCNTSALLVITSPEHLYRSVKTFEKAGFIHTGGLATFEDPVDEEQIKDKENSRDARVKSVALRYNMWSYMNYELLVLKEYCAISYYKLKGWI
jgi:uncharacterized SAM-binding protein YcdF (DUF218 family)